MSAAVAGVALYIAMVGGGGKDVWRQSSRLGNRVSLMWAAEGRTDGTCVVWRRSNRMHREAGRAALTVSGEKRARARRWLYLERMTMGTHQVHSLTYASASLLYIYIYINYNLFCFLLVSWHHGPTPLSTYVVVNKRENCTRSGRQLGPSSSSSICVFEVWALQSFSMFSPDINFSPLNNNENIAAAINWAGYGPSSPGKISSPDINFFQAENG